MAKMNVETAKRVKALGINAKNEDEAREKLLEILNENGIEGMEEEDTDTLIEIVESFVDEGSSSDADDAETGEPEESIEDALADEVEAEDAENEDSDEAEGAEEDALASMDRTALKAYIKDNSLDITVKKSWSDDDIREQIRNAECSADEGEKEDEEEPTPAPAQKKAEKKEKKVAEKKVSKRGQRLDPKNNEEDRKAFEPLHEFFPEEESVYAWVASAGVTIKHKGKNSQRAMVNIENCSKQADNTIKCDMLLPTFTKQTDVLDDAGIEYKICWSGAPIVKGITMDFAIDIIKALMPNITATIQKIDKRLGDNRAKMEESLLKKASPAAKKTVKK